MVISEPKDLSPGFPFALLSINIADTSQVGDGPLCFHNQTDNLCYFTIDLNRIEVMQQTVIFIEIQMSPHGIRTSAQQL